MYGKQMGKKNSEGLRTLLGIKKKNAEQNSPKISAAPEKSL